MGLSYHKRECLKRARELLARRDDCVLHYAALELRFCIEAITYDKLRTYAPRLPVFVVETWQPPQAMKALVQIEPDAARSFTLRMGNEDPSGDPIGGGRALGTHHALDVAWLRKIYNKLGNYLHVPSPKKTDVRPPGPDPVKVRKDLDEAASVLEAVASNTIDCSLAMVVDFECPQCKQIVLANAEGVRKTKLCQCLNPSCNAMYRAEEDSGGVLSFRLEAITFECGKCKEPIELENRKLTIGLEFSCDACGAKHKIVDRQWAAAVYDAEGAAKDEAAQPDRPTSSSS